VLSDHWPRARKIAASVVALALPLATANGISEADRTKLSSLCWTAASISPSFQSGNSRQATLSASAELARRTPATTIQLNYLGNDGEAEGVQDANNQRINGLYDIRLNRHWFLRPVYLEY
jgi:hypothetical protein